MPRKATGQTRANGRRTGGRRGAARATPLPFQDKLILNRWIVSLFGVEAVRKPRLNGKEVRPFQVFTELLKDETEGLGPDGRHRFYERLRLGNDLFTWTEGTCSISRDDLLRYEDRISAHTQAINARRGDEPIKWKYFQWLELLFTEIYLDRYFHDRTGLLADLNGFVERFNEYWTAQGYASVSPYTEEDLNKVCVQIATGGGKTLLMHVNLLQYRQYEKEAGGGKLDYAYLITPNERLSAQHLGEFGNSGIFASRFVLDGPTLGAVQVMEISKLAETSGPTTVATSALGNRNLLLVDEAHAGISGGKSEKKEDRAWQRRRSAICEKGFAFEYSATFAQAVKGTDHEEAYAKSVLFDYSYRWFYADGYGKDYRIFNIPEKGTLPDIRFRYLTGMLLSHYQQLMLWETGVSFREAFHLEKPLWVFVGSTVSAGKKGALSDDSTITATDVAEIMRFVARFLDKPGEATAAIADLLWRTGAQNGLLAADGTDLFTGAFSALKTSSLPSGAEEASKAVYSDILRRVFHGQSGRLVLERIPGKDGEIVLRAQGSSADEPFGLVNVGSPKELCDHLAALPDLAESVEFAPETEFTQPLFGTLRESSSPVNLLVGSKKFVEGWDCWRVGTLGLMHVGQSEGAQIVQLFGRGVRLKGWERRLKRSSRSGAPQVPPNLPVLETLGVFGIEADFMQKFRDYLKDEGLPGNERSNIVTMPLAVTYNFGRRLKILRPKKNGEGGRECDFKRDARVPRIDGDIPEAIVRNPVVADWYPRIASIESRSRNLSATAKNVAVLPSELLSLLDWDEAYFALEDFKRERSWHNFDFSPGGLRAALERAVAPMGTAKPWYTLLLPEEWLAGEPSSVTLRTAQAIAVELLKRYAERLYNDRKSAFYEPRLELRDVTEEDLMIPPPDDMGNRLYSFSIEGTTEEEAAAIAADIKRLEEELKAKRDELVEIGNIRAIRYQRHLFEPLFSLRQKGKISIQPVCLEESEFQFVNDLCRWAKAHVEDLAGREIYLLRNVSTSRGIGFFEAANFHPDFLLWMVEGEKQHVIFVEPHGLVHERKDSPKVRFSQTIKEIERRLGDTNVILDSYILSMTPFSSLLWTDVTEQDLADRHVLFLDSGADAYIPKLLAAAKHETPL
jgi:hypothetical protein